MTTEPRAVVSYPLLPLKNVVVFPRTVPIGLTVGRPKSLAAIERAIASDHKLVVSAQKTVDAEEPGGDDLFTTGTLVNLTKVDRMADGTMQIVVEGFQRVSLDKIEEQDGGFVVSTTECVDALEVRSDALTRQVLERFEYYISLNRNLPADALEMAQKVNRSPGRLADTLAAYLPLDLPVKQAILDQLRPDLRLEQATDALAREIDVQELEQQIRARVRQQMDKNQREYYLKEQLKAIHEELGSDAHSEAQDLLKKIEEKELPEAIAVKLTKEVARLERLTPSSPEGNVIRTYLDVALSLPWNERSDERIEVQEAERILDEDHFGLEKVKERILEFLAVRQLLSLGSGGDAIHGPILCFVGPPGVGKTSLGRSIARSLQRKFVRLSLGGVRDEAEIRGHRRTYVGALPGRLIQAVRTAGVSNPVILLDEIDKMTSDFRGDPGAALLEVLDPEQNTNFTDHYLELPFDLSQVMFITTANSLGPIPRPLRDRMEVVEIPGYTEEEKVEIVRRFLLPKQVSQHGLDPEHITLTRPAIQSLIDNYTREAGVRNLERAIASLCRKVAAKVLRNPKTRVKVTPSAITELLGPARFARTGPLDDHQVGVAIGLAWTEHGGEILPVEVATMGGKGSLTITGRLGDVMQESARAALSYARARSAALKIAPDFQETTDLHIHLPEGAVPKDGPSAGITMASALISALTRRPVRSDVAMTGEITLRGRVLPIGGLKEKVLAANRAGIKVIIAPSENERDLVEIPRKIRDQMSFHWVSTMDEVLKLILVQQEGPPDPPLESPPPPDAVVIDTSALA